MRNVLKKLLPDVVVRWYRPAFAIGWCRTMVGTIRGVVALYRTPRVEACNRGATEIFADVYERNVWGGERGSFYSGGGSEESVSWPYIELLRDFLSERPESIVVDIGCGDFRVGARLVASAPVRYVGVDVVPALIEHNQRSFGCERVSFVCLDAVTDELPTGDVLLVRQVLQHLSNVRIQQFIDKLANYKDVFVTEHYLSEDEGVIANVDKPTGADIRLPWSAVYLDKPPFSLKTPTCILSVKLDQRTELRTFHIGPAAEISGTPD